jgi:hypothetical protein
MLGKSASVLDPDMCYPESEFSVFFSVLLANFMVEVKVAP